MKTCARVGLSVLFVIILGAGCNMLYAQPLLNFKRVTSNWPAVELYFTASCNNVQTRITDKSFFSIRENDIEIDSFQLHCPDPSKRCVISVALVFDASGSMLGPGNAGAKAAGLAFIDLMDEGQDEAAILWFNYTVTVAQQMTTYKDLLANAVNGLPAAGPTAVWDGAYSGVMNLINDGVNPCRAVIVMTDGADGSSSRTPNEIVALANRNRVRVYTVGYGSGIEATQLRYIAESTGGRYFETQNAAEIASFYRSIFAIISSSFENECLITYEASCKDGGTRNVELALSNFCGGSDAKTKSWRAPRDTTTFEPLGIRIPDATIWSGDTAVIPLELTTPLNNVVIHPAQFALKIDHSRLQLEGVDTPTGCLLEGVPITVAPTPDGHVITTGARTMMTTQSLPAPLALLRFTVKRAVMDSISAGIGLADWIFQAGCFAPQLSGGVLKAYSDKLGAFAVIDSITSKDGRVFVHFRARCKGAFATSLEAGAAHIAVDGIDTPAPIVSGPTAVNGMTAEFADPCPDGGTHQLELRLQPFCDTVFTMTRAYKSEKRNLGVTVTGSRHLCPGDTARLDAVGGYSSYAWSDGSTTSHMVVTGAGEYFYTATGPGGCVLDSDTIRITGSVIPVITPPGPITICEGKTVTLDAGAGYVSYEWSNGHSGRLLVVSESGDYHVTAVDGEGCVMTSAAARVDAVTELHPSITASGPKEFCEGDIVVLLADQGYQRYVWSTGDTTAAIVVGSSGSYTVTVYLDGGCSGTSEPVTVTVHPLPAKPSIYRTGDDLSTDTAYAYQWYFGDVEIPGGTSRSQRAVQTGTYRVKVTNSEGCSAMSETYMVTTLPAAHTPDAESFAIDVHPNPAGDAITVSLRGLDHGTARLRLYDPLGRELRSLTLESSAGAGICSFSLAGLPPGIYLFRAEHGSAAALKLFVRK